MAWFVAIIFVTVALAVVAAGLVDSAMYKANKFSSLHSNALLDRLQYSYKNPQITAKTDGIFLVKQTTTYKNADTIPSPLSSAPLSVLPKPTAKQVGVDRTIDLNNNVVQPPSLKSTEDCRCANEGCAHSAPTFCPTDQPEPVPYPKDSACDCKGIECILRFCSADQPTSSTTKPKSRASNI